MHKRPTVVFGFVLLGFGFLLLLVAVSVAGASPRDSIVVSTPWLAAHLHDRDLVLLHVGDKAQYEVAHIPGARFVDAEPLRSWNFWW